ncbi:MAG: ABC transporter ATP-binding protein [Eubacteriales bacterium]
MSILEIRSLKKSFADLTAVNDLNLSIEEGEIHGVLGPNGAGKSTTIHCVLGLLPYDSGSVTFQKGETIKTWSKNIGYVPQEYAIYPNLTPSENIRFFCSLYGFKGAELQDRVEKALDFVGLIDVKDKKSDEFSGGMKRRLNLACGIAHSPKLIIMDEPTVGIDPQSRNRILENVQTLQKEGATIIYTTHYMPEVEALCDKITVIDHGSVITSGSKSEIMQKLGKDVELELQFVENKGNLSAFEAEIQRIQDIHKTEIEDWTCKLHLLEETLAIDSILQIASKHALIPKKIQTNEASLEELFLMLTGKEFRDES